MFRSPGGNVENAAAAMKLFVLAAGRCDIFDSFDGVFLRSVWEAQKFIPKKNGQYYVRAPHDSKMAEVVLCRSPFVLCTLPPWPSDVCVRCVRYRFLADSRRLSGLDW